MARRPKRCRECGGGPDVVGQISRAGLCGACAWANMVANAEQIRDRTGPYYERWLAGQVDAATARLRVVRGLDVPSADAR